MSSITLIQSDTYLRSLVLVGMYSSRSSQR